jgi:catecholate siderophore receptor
VTTTLGNHNYRRMSGDFNLKTGDNAALRINAMATKADNNGAGSRIDKQGIAGAYRFGADTRDEFTVGLFHLENHNGINYGIPWIRPNATDSSAANQLISGLDPSTYYGLASDRNDGSASTATLNHIHRFDGGSELKSTVRRGHYTRDQRASAIRFAGTTAPTNGTNPLTNPAAVDLSHFGPATVLNRGNNTKVQDLDTLSAQSDFSTRLQAFGLAHQVLSGFDFAREEKTVYRLSAVTKPQTLAGTPDDGLAVDEDARTPSVASGFVNRALGVYAQDLVQIAPAWKLLGGLRWDRTHGVFDTFDATTGALTTVQQRISAFSRRAGVLYQPSETASFHASWGTSFNTSGDTYSLSPLSAQTAPESSENIEIGARLDSADKRVTTRLALFRATKKNERNTDVDTAATAFLLSGQRHSAGFDMDITGRLTPAWEVYGSYMWLPIAKVDQAVPPTATNTSSTFGNRQGDRPGLTPRHSGTVWTTYQLTEALRVGGGLNFRSRQAPADIGTAGGAQSWEAPGFVTADLMAEVVVLPQRLTVKANLSNVANTLYAESLYRGHYVPGAGRLLQVGASVKF